MLSQMLNLSSEAWIFLPLVVPICLWVAYTDLKDMKILNISVAALLAVFVVGGLLALPLSDYLWRYAHFAVVLVIGFVASAGLGVGAGDAKFAAAAAPFVVLSDWSIFLLLLSATSILGVVLHRAAKRVPAIRNATPGWQSWQEDKAFPWGVSIASALAIYLCMGLAQAA